VNTVLQPTNQAVRNAWFSGGVEWNVSLRGHCPFTCAPLFAQEQRLSGGTPLLRMFEFERVRRVPFAIDCWLPAGSEFLFVRVHLWNPHAETIPMYWWSNIAVPEKDKTRVLVPTDHTFHYAYRGCMRRVAIPVIDGVDLSYPRNLTQAADYFYDIPDGRRPWIAAVDAQGRGLVQTSTLTERGRKMFAWGMGSGGRRWQRFLTQGAGTYFEIQAGLAQTQYECVPMPPGAYWSWVEACGPLETDAGAVHHRDWSVATEHVRRQLERALPMESLDQQLDAPGPAFDAPPCRWLNYGSGWGALESQVRQSDHGGRVANAECAAFALFPLDSIRSREQRWALLLHRGDVPAASASELPDSWLVGRDWRGRLEAASANAANNHWLTWWHLGIAAYHDGDRAAAEAAWRKSLDREPNAWSYRNLAVLARENGEAHQACRYLFAAHQLQPSERNIAIEYTESLVATGQMEELLQWYDGLDPGLAAAPRLLLMRAQAQLAVGRLDAVEQLLTSDFELPDLREGDTVLTDLWYELMVQRYAIERGIPVTDVLRQQINREHPPPANIDFRLGSSSDRA
jgi:tetratricopeptide (TPR) repeat protein